MNFLRIKRASVVWVLILIDKGFETAQRLATLRHAVARRTSGSQGLVRHVISNITVSYVHWQCHNGQRSIHNALTRGFTHCGHSIW